MCPSISFSNLVNQCGKALQYQTYFLCQPMSDRQPKTANLCENYFTFFWDDHWGIPLNTEEDSLLVQQLCAEEEQCKGYWIEDNLGVALLISNTFLDNYSNTYNFTLKKVLNLSFAKSGPKQINKSRNYI